MKESVIDVIMYIIDHYVDEDNGLSEDQDAMAVELRQLGFETNVISKAFEWLSTLAETELVTQADSKNSVGLQRIFTPYEQRRLSLMSRGFLYYVEQSGLCTPVLREEIIQHALALDADVVNVDQVKWLCLMVLFNQSDTEGLIYCSQEGYCPEVGETLH